MIPKSLSASAAQTYEACSAMYKAHYIDRVPDLSGDAAGLGTVCHNTLERWVTESHYITKGTLDYLVDIYKEEYNKIFSKADHRADGLAMIKRWFEKQTWTDREVLSCELKETFDLNVKGYGVIPITYIWDRCDQLPGDVIEVIDYKTVRAPIQPDDLKERIQPRIYALSAYLKYPNAKEIWVTYDLLRYEEVGVKFTPDECRETYKYLLRLARRILADDGATERLNPDCRYCVRASKCETLLKHQEAGGALAITDIDMAIDRRAELDYAKKAIQKQIDDLDAFLMEKVRDPEEGFMERKTASTIFKVGGKKYRKVESERLARIIDPSVYAKFAKISVTDFDKMVSSGLLSPEEEALARQCTRMTAGRPTITTKPRTEVGDGLDD